MSWPSDKGEAKWFLVEKESIQASIKTLPHIDRKDYLQIKGQNRRVDNTWEKIGKITYKTDDSFVRLCEMARQCTANRDLLKGLKPYSQVLENNTFNLLPNDLKT